MARGSGDPPTRWRGYGMTMVTGDVWGEVDKIMDDKIMGTTDGAARLTTRRSAHENGTAMLNHHIDYERLVF